jgi:hypothetical protein
LILRRSRRVLTISLLACACAPSGRDDAALSSDERVFVDTYVRILVLDAWRDDAPDSVGPALDRLAATHDSTAVRAALRRLAAEPERWERVYDAVARRLHELEREPTPLSALRKLDAVNAAGPAATPATRPEAPRSP